MGTLKTANGNIETASSYPPVFGPHANPEPVRGFHVDPRLLDATNFQTARLRPAVSLLEKELLAYSEQPKQQDHIISDDEADEADEADSLCCDDDDAIVYEEEVAAGFRYSASQPIPKRPCSGFQVRRR